MSFSVIDRLSDLVTTHTIIAQAQANILLKPSALYKLSLYVRTHLTGSEQLNKADKAEAETINKPPWPSKGSASCSCTEPG